MMDFDGFSNRNYLPLLTRLTPVINESIITFDY